MPKQTALMPLEECKIHVPVCYSWCSRLQWLYQEGGGGGACLPHERLPALPRNDRPCYRPPISPRYSIYMDIGQARCHTHLHTYVYNTNSYVHSHISKLPLSLWITHNSRYACMANHAMWGKVRNIYQKHRRIDQFDVYLNPHEISSFILAWLYHVHILMFLKRTKWNKTGIESHWALHGVQNCFEDLPLYIFYLCP